MREKHSDIFLGFSESDRGLAALIASSLTASGFDVSREISGPTSDTRKLGKNWMSGLKAAVQGAKCVVVLLTPRSLESRWAAFVTGLGMGLNKPLLFLVDGLVVSELPAFIQQQSTVDVSRLPTVIPDIKAMVTGASVAVSI